MPEAAPNRTKPVRADAQRNREHILDVAEEYFAEHGVNGSLDALAKQARVGTGTLYRHFPTREALLAALLTARAISWASGAAMADERSGEALTALTRAGWETS